MTGPANNLLEIGKDTTFTAATKDASGNTLTGKTITWASSDPYIATVNPTSGVVTPRRVGSVVITATSEGKIGNSASQRTFGVEVAGGTWNANTVGTHAVIRVRDESGLPPSVQGTGEITGPSGWNNNQPQSLTIPASNTIFTYWNGSPQQTAVSGTYRITLTFGSKIYTSSFNIDANSRLPIPTVVLPAVSSTSVSASWGAITGAQRYKVDILGNAGSGIISSTSTTITPSPTLSVATNYTLRVDAMNYVPTSDTANRLPDQVNYSTRDTSFTLP